MVKNNQYQINKISKELREYFKEFIVKDKRIFRYKRLFLMRNKPIIIFVVNIELEPKNKKLYFRKDIVDINYSKMYYLGKKYYEIELWIILE